MNCCTSRCGFCGRCDDGLREGDDPWRSSVCHTCGGTIGLTGTISTAAVGVFCSFKCAEEGVSRHEQAIAQKTRSHARTA